MLHAIHHPSLDVHALTLLSVRLLNLPDRWRSELLTPLWKLPLVQAHANRVHLPERAIKMSLEVPMSSQRFGDVPDPPEFGVQLNRFVVLDIFAVEEHVFDRRYLFVDLEWETGEDDSFGYDAGRVGGEEGSHCY